jgi:hypothetical protein
MTSSPTGCTVAADGSQRRGGFLATVRVSGGEQHRHAELGELRGGLAPNSFVSPQ